MAASNACSLVLVCCCLPQGDIPASQMLNSLPGIDPARRDRLIEVLDIDPTWRMHLVSGAYLFSRAE